MAPAARRRAFSLTELVMVTAVLAVVLLLLGRIFSTATAVSRTGVAVTRVVHEAAVIERALRSDFAQLAPEGVLAIRCVAVPNDLGGRDRLLDPARDADAVIRADQILYFTNGVQPAHTFRHGAGADRRAASASARVYFGHAYQLAEAGPPAEVRADGVHAWDALDDLVPWSGWTPAAAARLVRTRFTSAGRRGDVYERGDVVPFRVPALDARRWLLARQAVLLADDETSPPDSNGKTVYLNELPTARSIFLDDPRPAVGFAPQVRDGRVDAAATQLDDLRRLLSYGPTGPRSPAEHHALVADALLYYPRAERRAPSARRVDHALTTSVIGTACSSVSIEWSSAADGRWHGPADPVGAAAIERVRRADGVDIYEAVFGPDRSATPWPSSIRVTLTLHDGRSTSDVGREVQFVVHLPARVRAS
jgi:type II secretory pathway pseudopilin PulG